MERDDVSEQSAGRPQPPTEHAEREPADTQMPDDVPSEAARRQQAEQELAASEERQRLAVEGADMGTWHWDIRANVQVWSERCKALFGLAPDEPVSYEAYLARVHPQDREQAQQRVAQAIAQKRPVDSEYRVVWPDGSVHWIAAKGQPYYDAHGQPVRFEGIVQNIDARKQAEEHRRRSAEEMALLVRKARCLLWHAEVADVPGHGLRWDAQFPDEAAADQQFQPARTTPGQDFADAWYGSRVEEDRVKNDMDAARSIRAGEDYTQEFSIRRRDGTILWMQENVSVEVLSPGHWRLVGVTTDIDQRRRAEADLRESEARKAAILEAALDCIIKIDQQGSVVEWNPAAENTFGYTRAQVLGKPLCDLIIPQPLREAHRRGLAHFLATGEGPILNRRLEVTALHATGREFPVEIAIVPVVLASRTLFIAYLRDLTEREQAATQRRAFLRDVLLSVTEGRLHLCHVPGDLPTRLPTCGEPILLSMTGGIAELRHQARQAAIAHAFADERWHDLVTAASEAAMNAVVHAGGGQGRVCASDDTVQVWVEDKGMGIDVAHLPRATLEKGYTTAGTLGQGMKMMLSTADRLWLLTGSTGTTVVLEQDRLPPVADWLRT